MRETRFIEQNQDKWAKFEKNLKSGHSNPDELSRQFVEITDDLSYSRTFYPNRSVRVYLNNIAQKVFYSVYKNQKSRLFRFFNFWKEDVPQIVYESRRSFWLALGVFFFAVLIGVFSSYMDPEFVRTVLGDDYVDATIRNIQLGRPMAVYQDPKQAEMFMGIFINNVIVSVLAFILGLFFGIGSLFILLRNGITLGAFQYMFLERGIYMDSIFTIWMHGSIEIPCIIIASAAGITLGSGLVFPKTYTRMQSLQLSARRALLIMLTVLPLLLYAAFIETFVTRYTDASYVARGIVIFGSLSFIIGYFIIYPMIKAKKGFTSFVRNVNLPPTQKSRLEFSKIKHSGQIFSDAFIFYRKRIKIAATVSLVLALIYTTVLISTGEHYNFRTVAMSDIMSSPELLIESIGAIVEKTVTNVMQLLFHHDIGIAWWLNYLTSGIMAYLMMSWIERIANKGKDLKRNAAFYINTVLSTAIVLAVIHFCTTADIGWIFITAIFLFPILMLWLATVFNEHVNPLEGLGKTFSLLGGNWLVMMGGYLVMMTMCLVFMFLATAPLSGLYFGFIVSAFPITDVELFRQGFYIFIYAYMICFLFPLVFSVMGIGYFSFKETRQATDLFETIPTIGVRKQSYGMDRE
ncbi:MAG: stage II sporulation protein M [Aureispira sp.]|nr:stage II sporulation protein M [Aureispira sp.]